jgi:hypothetical protein
MTEKQISDAWIVKTLFVNSVLVPALLPAIPLCIFTSFALCSFIFFLISLLYIVPVLWFYIWYYNNYRNEFFDTLQSGMCPKQFADILCPFYLPLWGTICLSLFCLPAGVEKPGHACAIFFVGTIWYSCYTLPIIISIGGSMFEQLINMSLCLLIVNSFVAVCGTVTMLRKAPAALKRRSGLLMILGITLVLAMIFFTVCFWGI